MLDSRVECVSSVENVGEIEGLGLFDVECIDDLDAEEDGLVECVGVPVRDIKVDRVAVPPV